jgi:hypothetical protein
LSKPYQILTRAAKESDVAWCFSITHVHVRVYMYKNTLQTFCSVGPTTPRSPFRRSVATGCSVIAALSLPGSTECCHVTETQ